MLLALTGGAGTSKRELGSWVEHESGNIQRDVRNTKAATRAALSKSLDCQRRLVGKLFFGQPKLQAKHWCACLQVRGILAEYMPLDDDGLSTQLTSKGSGTSI